MAVAGPRQESELDVVLAPSTDTDPVIEISPAEAVAMVPFLRTEGVTRAVFEPGVTDIEVATILRANLKAFKARGGKLVTNEPLTALEKGDACTVTTRKNTCRAKTVINAAGAWADDVGDMVGATKTGLVAKRRTAIIVETFVWHAGQGGYGIMMAPALAVAVAAICGVRKLPNEFAAHGVK